MNSFNGPGFTYGSGTGSKAIRLIGNSVSGLDIGICDQTIVDYIESLTIVPTHSFTTKLMTVQTETSEINYQEKSENSVSTENIFTVFSIDEDNLPPYQHLLSCTDISLDTIQLARLV